MTMPKNPEKGQKAPGSRPLDCQAWEAMVADALDGTLEARDAEAFTAHSKECVGCGELLEEAQRGTEWLRFLRETPEAPEGLLEKILAGTSGVAEVQPLAAMGAVALPRQPWLGVPAGLIHRHMAESRILMTLAMAFFSLALTLNLTGLHLNQLKLSDLRPSTLASSVSHQYFTTSAHLKVYYTNLRFVYEVESRLNEIRHDDQPQQALPVNQQQQPQPSGKPNGAASNGPARNGRSSTAPSMVAPRGGAVIRPRDHDRYEPPTPVLAAYPRRQCGDCGDASYHVHSPMKPLQVAFPVIAYPVIEFSVIEYPGECHKPIERSLV